LSPDRLVGQTSGVTGPLTPPASGAPAPHRRRLAELRAPDVLDALGERSIVVQPLGAIEQHGPHLPLYTDLLIAESVAAAAVERAGEELDVWLLPALAYTKSDEHAWSPGTIWLSAATMLAVLDDIGRCVALTPARRFVAFNGHGGNSALLGVANRELRRRHGLMTFLAHPSLPPDQGPTFGDTASITSESGFGIHAGADETSLVLHLAPHLVDLAAGARAVPEHLAINRHVRFGGPVSFGWLSNDFADNGVIGDPTGATAERGAELFEAAVDAFCEALAEIARFEYRADR
jgi:creatinine amidohydrolase